MKIFSMIIGLAMLLDIPSLAEIFPQALVASTYIIIAGILIAFPLYLEFMH